MRVVVVLALAASLATPAFAQRAERPEERRTVIDMEADVIEGDLKRPDHIVFRPHIRREFRSLIQMRESFRREVLASAAQL